jgi:hypothetical protein
VAAVVAGPALIVTGVLAILHAFAFRSLMTTSDVLRYWLPTYCFMGRGLAAGHIVGWNPHVMGGVPFAADPQSGWMYLPAMTLFSALPCGVAIRWMIVLQPLLAGLGLYWFLRGERLSRASSTVGGIVLSLGIAGAQIALSLPFAGTLAWTSLALAAASRFFRASGWPRRLLWCLLTAGAWGQLAAAHFSTGLVVGTLALIAFAAVKVFGGAAEGVPGRRDRLAMVGVLALSLGLVNLANLLPRLTYVPETNLSLGYAALQHLGEQVASHAVHPVRIVAAARPTWPLRLATSPGAHLGALALGLSFGGWWSLRRHRLAMAFSAFGLVCYLLSLKWVATGTPQSIRPWRPVDLYLHSPEWFGYGVILAVAVLAGLGLEAWMEARSAPERALMVVPGIVVWGIIPFLFGAPPWRVGLTGLGAVVGAGALLGAIRRPRLALLAPLVLAAELGANGLLPPVPPSLERSPVLLASLSHPRADPNEFLRPGPLLGTVLAEGGGRHVTVSDVRGIRSPVQSITRVLLPDLSMVNGTEDVAAFNPLQLLRYWVYVRAVQGREISYNHSTLLTSPPPALDLLDVRWVIGRTDRPPPVDAIAVATEGRWRLYRRAAPPRASLISSWSVVASSNAAFPNPALTAVLSPGFDSTAQAVLEEDPGISSGSAGTTGPEPRYQQLGPQSVRVTVETSTPALLVIGNAYDPNWHATVDGRSARLLRADYVLQAVPVPPGNHTVVLEYDDPWIGYGLGGSGCAVAILLAAAFVLSRRSRSAVSVDALTSEPGPR